MKIGQSPPKPLTLHPLTVEEAVKELLKAKPEPKTPKHSGSGIGRMGKKKSSE